MRFLLDTNVISEVAKPRPSPKVLNWLLQHEANSGVPAIAIAERYQGANEAEPERRMKLLAEVDWFVTTQTERIVPFDAPAAKAWGEYVANGNLRGTPRGYADSQIAAIALARGMTVVTRNTVDFPDVATLNPWGG
jgi:toxin FitB